MGHSPQQAVEIMQERNKKLVAHNWTFVIKNTVKFTINFFWWVTNLTHSFFYDVFI